MPHTGPDCGETEANKAVPWRGSQSSRLPQSRRAPRPQLTSSSRPHWVSGGLRTARQCRSGTDTAPLRLWQGERQEGWGGGHKNAVGSGATQAQLGQSHRLCGEDRLGHGAKFSLPHFLFWQSEHLARGPCYYYPCKGSLWLDLSERWMSPGLRGPLHRRPLCGCLNYMCWEPSWLSFTHNTQLGELGTVSELFLTFPAVKHRALTGCGALGKCPSPCGSQLFSVKSGGWAGRGAPSLVPAAPLSPQLRPVADKAREERARPSCLTRAASLSLLQPHRLPAPILPQASSAASLSSPELLSASNRPHLRQAPPRAAHRLSERPLSLPIATHFGDCVAAPLSPTRPLSQRRACHTTGAKNGGNEPAQSQTELRQTLAPTPRTPVALGEGKEQQYQR